jgi:hypothetical protein
MSDPKQRDDEYSEEESKRRFEAALRGAQLVPPTPMKDIPPALTKSGAPRKKRSPATKPDSKR